MRRWLVVWIMAVVVVVGCAPAATPTATPVPTPTATPIPVMTTPTPTPTPFPLSGPEERLSARELVRDQVEFCVLGLEKVFGIEMPLEWDPDHKGSLHRVWVVGPDGTKYHLGVWLDGYAVPDDPNSRRYVQPFGPNAYKIRIAQRKETECNDPKFWVLHEERAN